MTNGLNQSFMNNPRGFLESRAMSQFNMSAVTFAAIAGNTVDATSAVGEFDFATSTHGGRVELYQFDQRYGNNPRKNPTKYSRRIKAYYLPWDTGKTLQITLGNDAKFFFTAQLSGCRVQIGGAGNSHVAHIAGSNILGNNTSSQWRSNQANAAGFGPNSRRYSFSQDYQDAYDANGWANVVGWKSGDEWNFLAQKVEPNAGGKFVVRPLSLLGHWAQGV